MVIVLLGYTSHVLERGFIPPKKSQGDQGFMEKGQQDPDMETLREVWEHEFIG